MSKPVVVLPQLGMAALAVLILALTTSPAPAQRAAPKLGVLTWTNSPPRAFLKNRHLRLYSSANGEQQYLTAEWEKARASSQEFSYHGVTLKPKKATRGPPKASSSWREVKVLDVTQGNRLIRAVIEHLAPARSEHGVYLQHAFGDQTLFRDASGTVQAVPFDKSPAGLVVDRRYSRHELSSAASTPITATSSINVRPRHAGRRGWTA